MRGQLPRLPTVWFHIARPSSVASNRGRLWSAYRVTLLDTPTFLVLGILQLVRTDEPILIGHEFQGGGSAMSGVTRARGDSSEQGYSFKPLRKEDSGESRGMFLLA